MRKKSMGRVGLAIILLISMIVLSGVSVSAENPSFTPAANDGMVFTPKNYVEKGVKCSYFMGTPLTVVDGGYNYSPLFGYLLNNEVDPQNTFLYIDDFTGWVSYSKRCPVPSATEETDPDNLGKWAGGGNMELRLGEETQNRKFEGIIYKAGYEVDLGEINKICGYVMHFSWANEGQPFEHNDDFDFYVSNDQVEWKKITATKGTKSKTESSVSLDEAGCSAFLSSACENVAVAGTYQVLSSNNIDGRGNASGRRHPVLDVKFDKAVEARYIRVAYKTAFHTPTNGNWVFCYGLEVYKATSDAPFEPNPTPKVASVVSEDPDVTSENTTSTTNTPKTTTSPGTSESKQEKKKGCSGNVVSAPAIILILGIGICVGMSRKKRWSQ